MAGFLNYWQVLPSNIDPVAFNIMNFHIRYYGLSYLFAFILTYFLIIYRINDEIRFSKFNNFIEELILYIIFGIFIGGRIGYVIFYGLDYYINKPLEIFLPIVYTNKFIFTGFMGMSYHGGLVGSLLATFIFMMKYDVNFFEITDLIIPTISLGYMFGRVGNFLNGELYGRPTNLFIGMYFPASGSDFLRHPSQLYEAFFEGFIIFIFLWIVRKKIFVVKNMLAIYLILYGIIRFIIEFFREPDSHIGIIYFCLSIGQMLSLVMILIGIIMFYLIFIKKVNN